MTWDTTTKYHLLLQINSAIVSESTKQGVFAALASALGSIFQFDRFCINLLDEETNSLNYFAAAKGISPMAISEDERPLAKGAIASAVIRSRQPFILKDLSSHLYWPSVKAMKDAGLNATMAFPLIVRDHVLGSLHLSYSKPPDDMDEMIGFLNEVSSQLAIVVDHMMTYTALKTINEQLRIQKEFLASQSGYRNGFREIFYESQAMEDVVRKVQKLADSDASVVITGETGTGKDLIARFMHQLSSRRDALFVKVNCPALNSALFESELFGHTKGAFTGAQVNRVGRFEMADGGTLFLDEIGELGISLQAKLLQAIQDKRIERVGESRSVEVDFRLLSATNIDLENALRNKSFRSDLYYRLNTMTIHVPPLRDRLEDIPVLARKLAAIQSAETHRPAPIFSDSCLKVMARYPWPGNVRELKNLLKRLTIMKPAERITAAEMEVILRGMPIQSCLEPLTLAEIERQHIIRAIKHTKGVVGGPNGAAAILGMPRQTLQYRLKKYGISLKGEINDADQDAIMSNTGKRR